jgi:hypothetical protein
MPEPMEMPNIEAIVETIRVARRSEEGARMHISISVQVKDAPQLLPFLATSLKNVVKVGFTEIQARLPENPPKPPATETVTTTVDGEPAKIVLPRNRRNSIEPHAFAEDPEKQGKCSVCNRGPQYEAHSPERIATASSNGHRANPTELAAQGAEREAAMQEAGKTRHAFVEHDGDNQCEACGRAAEADAHAGVAEEGDLPPPAQYLVDAAKETEAVPS